MTMTKFDEILKYAIDREYEAAEFYRYMQDLVKFKNQKEMLREFELMEDSHAAALKSLNKSAIEEISITNVENLKISDYVVEKTPSPDMSYQDIIIIAMKREEAANRLYTQMAQSIVDPTVKKLFEKLASEELKHKLHFEKIYDDEFLDQN